jgi:hypothetical protein
MGGNALQAASVRLPASRYRAVERALVRALAQRFPGPRITALMAYADKPDFGDLDILIEAGAHYDPALLAQALDATEIVCNGDVTSIGVRLAEGIFQVDLIKTAPASFDFAERYFGLNDFGNLVGRVAHKFGAKFGHLGLQYMLRDAGNASHLIEEICITTDFGAALTLLGYDAARYENMRSTGQFRTLDDIFRFVVSTPFVNREIYLFDNMNHASRIRDAKRATYNAFLAWLDLQAPGLVPAYAWGENGSAERTQQQDGFLDAAFNALPAFRERYDRALALAARRKLVKLQFNGALAAEATGLSGKPLGELMTGIRASFPDQDAFETFFIEASPEAVKATYARAARQYCKSHGQ